MSNTTMNVIFSSDDNYSRHLGALIYSLLENNKTFEKISLYIIDNDISLDNRQKITTIASAYPNSDIVWIPFSQWKSKLHLNLAWDISVSTYARLFIAEMLPESVERVLYLDCDMIVCDSLNDLWKTELGSNIIGAVQDDINDITKDAVGLAPDDPYFNAGMLLIDLRKWREERIGDKALAFLDERHGQVIHHDQGILNGILKSRWLRLIPHDNLMTIHYIFNDRQVRKYYQDHSVFYTAEEISDAKDHPVILHYTPSFTTRPWVKNCAHPEKQRYWDAVSNTPWAGTEPISDDSKWYVKLINFKYRVFKI